MPLYLMLTTLTEKGIQTLNSNPGRLREVNLDLEELGARIPPPVGLASGSTTSSTSSGSRRRDGREACRS